MLTKIEFNLSAPTLGGEKFTSDVEARAEFGKV
jgi:hypothetical protein